MNRLALMFAAAALLSLLQIPVLGENFEQLNAKFEKSLSALTMQHASALINYLKKNPQADDFGDALKALAELDIPKKEGPVLRDLMQKRSVFLEAQLSAPKDPAKAFAQTDELLKLDKYLGNEDETLRLLEKEYDLLMRLPEGEERLEAAVGQKGVVTALISEYQGKRMKTEALAFLDRVKKDFPAIKPEALVAVEKAFASMDTVGEPFTLDFKSTNGQEINLADYKGKVVLVDFWATWCGPCVQAMPDVIELYEKFHGQGFEVLGISLDEDREALQKFVSNRKIPWPQFFDGNGWKNELAVAHGISAIPATFLIDRDNKLAAIGLDGNELGAKVAELLQQSTPESGAHSEGKGPP